MSTIYQKLLSLQQTFRASKDQRNQFGNFNYRNVEAMLDTLKPLLQQHGLVVLFSETMHQCATDIMTCKCTLIDVESGESVSNESCVRVDAKYKGMSEAQASGASITYLRKYTLGGLLAVGTEKDPDSLPMNSSESPTWQTKIVQCTTKEQLVSLWATIPQDQKELLKPYFTAQKQMIK